MAKAHSDGHQDDFPSEFIPHKWWKVVIDRSGAKEAYFFLYNNDGNPVPNKSEGCVGLAGMEEVEQNNGFKFPQALRDLVKEGMSGDDCCYKLSECNGCGRIF